MENTEQFDDRANTCSINTLGWIKLSRSIMYDPGYHSEAFCRNMAWVDLNLLANHSDGYFRCRGIPVHVSRGQIGYGLDALAMRWKWSRGKVERFMVELESDGKIVRQKNNVTTLISIVNYCGDSENGKANDKANSKANRRQTVKQTVKQTDANNNDKELIEGEEWQSASPPPPDQTFTDDERESFRNFQEWIEKFAPRVGKMKEPFTINQYLALKEKGWSTVKIRELLADMHNWADLHKKRVSAYLTLLNWKRREEK